MLVVPYPEERRRLLACHELSRVSDCLASPSETQDSLNSSSALGVAVTYAQGGALRDSHRYPLSFLRCDMLDR